MSKRVSIFVLGLATIFFEPSQVAAQSTLAVAVPAQAGVVNGERENSDAVIWRLFTQVAAPASKAAASPVVFETWASDDDTFNVNPVWPAGNAPTKLHVSVLEAIKSLSFDQPDNLSKQLNKFSLASVPIDVPCKPPPNSAVGNFPTNGKVSPCIGEQTKRNRPMFDYIVNNHLNTKAGLAAAFANSLKVEMPVESIAVKSDWVPLNDLLRWVPGLNDETTARRLYYTTTVATGNRPGEYALVALHVGSRQNPNWVWGTFEHHLNPGRCDYIGCFDSFGATIPAVSPNRVVFGSQYGVCQKTKRLKELMAKEDLLPVWENYCLKSTEVDFTSANGTPYVLGNSVIEGIVGNGTVAASSCISCHSYASFGPEGSPTGAATAMLPFNPTGKTIAAALAGSKTFAFMWGVFLAP